MPPFLPALSKMLFLKKPEANVFRYWKPYILIFFVFLIGLVAGQWLQSRSIESYNEIEMLEHKEEWPCDVADKEKFPGGTLEKEKTPWQKYRMRCGIRKLGLETPAAPPSPELLLIADTCKSFFQSPKPQENTECADDAQPIE